MRQTEQNHDGNGGQSRATEYILTTIYSVPAYYPVPVSTCTFRAGGTEVMGFKGHRVHQSRLSRVQMRTAVTAVELSEHAELTENVNKPWRRYSPTVSEFEAGEVVSLVMQ